MLEQLSLQIYDQDHIYLSSLQYVGEITFLHYSAVLLKSNTKAIKKIFGICRGEHRGISERCLKSFAVTVLLNSLNNISKTISLQSLLSENRVEVRAFLIDIRKLSFINITRVHWMSHKSLIVWDWPGWS